MTDLELFPRGKAAKDGASGAAHKNKSSGADEASGGNVGKEQGARGGKRKAVGSPRPEGDDKDWLFGAPVPKASATGTTSRKNDEAGSSGGRLGTGKGKASVPLQSLPLDSDEYPLLCVFTGHHAEIL